MKLILQIWQLSPELGYLQWPAAAMLEPQSHGLGLLIDPLFEVPSSQDLSSDSGRGASHAPHQFGRSAGRNSFQIRLIRGLPGHQLPLAIQNASKLALVAEVEKAKQRRLRD